MAEEFTFTSLGGVWLDELRWPGRAPRKDVVGGSATFATLGARLFVDHAPQQLVLIVQAGSDFPVHVLEQLQSWRVTMHVIRHSEKLSTRGILEHSAIPGYACFTRVTPALLTSPVDLTRLGIMSSTFIHLFGTAEIARSECAQLRELCSQTQQGVALRSRIVWEPHPKSCIPELLADHTALLKSGAITVFSPNHFELSSLLKAICVAFDSELDRHKIEDQADLLWNTVDAADAHPLEALIIRAAEKGCLVRSRQRMDAVWLPAFWSDQQQNRVVDPTGAGNSFLGALTQGWIETGSWVKAACYATVAASVVVEHVGVPLVELNGKDETWSGVNIRQRLHSYMDRVEVRTLLAAGC